MRVASVALCITVLFVSACAAPSKVNIVDVSAQVRATPEPLESWWRQFQDPLIDSLISDLLEQNLDLKSGLLRVKEARARRLSNEAVLEPKVDAGLNTSRGNSQVSSITPETLSRGLFEASWEVDLFGANQAALRAEDAFLDESVLQAFDTRRLITAELVQAVVDYRYLGKQLHKQNELRDSQSSQIKVIKARQLAGLADSAALENAIAQRERTIASISLVEARRKAAQFRAERLLGKRAYELSAKFDETAKTSINLPTPVDGLEIPLETLKNRPDVKAAYFRLAASGALVSKAEADFWPKLRLSAFLGVQQASDGLENFIAPNPIWSISSSLTAPILNRKTLESNVQVMQAREEIAVVTYQNSILTALQESQTFLSDYLAGYNVMNRQTLATERQRSVLDIATKRYQAGLTDYLPVTIAEENLIRMDIERILSEQEAARSYIGLRRAISG